MKTAIVYLSLNGNSRLIVDKLKNKIVGHVDIFPIKFKEDIPATRWMQTLKFGLKTFTSKEIKYHCEFNSNESYDMVIVGTPIWFGRIPLPIMGILTDLSYSHRKIAVFGTYQIFPGRFVDRVYNILDVKRDVSVREFRQPKTRNPNYLDREID